MADVAISTRPHTGDWCQLGRGAYPGVTPDQVTMTANQAGSDQLTFTLARPSDMDHMDLQPLARVRCEAPGSGVVWSGRVRDVAPNDRGLVVTCRGHQADLDDDVWRRVWVHSRLTEWRDQRSTPGVNLGFWSSLYQVAGLQGGWVLSIPSAYTNVSAVGVNLDLGYACARRVSVDWSSLVGGIAAVQLVIRGADDEQLFTNVIDNTTATNTMAASGTITTDLATAKRYVGVYLNVTGTGTLASQLALQLTGIRVAGDNPGYLDAGGASALTASHVIQDIRAAKTTLNQDQTRIASTAFAIPHLTTEGGYETHRTTMARANAYHDYLTGVDAARRVFLQQRPSTPILSIGARSGDAVFQDAGTTSDDAFNRVLIQALNTTGGTTTVERTGASSPLTQAGVTRTKVLTAQAPLTTTAAQQVGDAWLARNTTRPIRGGITIRGPGAAWWTETGWPARPADTLRLPGQRVRIGDRRNPDTGGVSVDATITAVTYQPATDTATLTLDQPRDAFDVLMARTTARRPT